MDRLCAPVKDRGRIQADLITLLSATGELKAYEVKRGFGNQDAEALRSIKDRLAPMLEALPD